MSYKDLVAKIKLAEEKKRRVPTSVSSRAAVAALIPAGAVAGKGLSRLKSAVYKRIKRSKEPEDGVISKAYRDGMAEFKKRGGVADTKASSSWYMPPSKGEPEYIAHLRGKKMHGLHELGHSDRLVSGGKLRRFMNKGYSIPTNYRKRLFAASFAPVIGRNEKERKNIAKVTSAGTALSHTPKLFEEAAADVSAMKRISKAAPGTGSRIKSLARYAKGRSPGAASYAIPALIASATPFAVSGIMNKLDPDKGKKRSKLDQRRSRK